VTDILLIARNHVVTALRERVTLFWFLIFPVFLLVILSLVFSGMGEEGEISFEISLVNLDRASPNAFSSMIEGAFDQLARSDEPGHEALFQIRKPAPDGDLQGFIDDETLAVRRGRRAALLVIPEGLGAQIHSELTDPVNAPADTALTIYYSEGNAASDMAVSIIEQVLAGIDRGILVQTGRFDSAAAIPQTTTWIGSEEGQTPYVDFLLPGIVLMGFFMNGLFGIPGAILFSRDQRVLRRYWVTPLSVPRFFAGTSIGHVALSAIQFAILFAVGRYALGATVSFASLSTVLLLLLAIVTFLAFGFLVASISKTGNAGMAIANILNMPMMFLSGLFFPIAGLPAFIRAIVYVNPLSYLADGLRVSTGIDTAAFPAVLTIAVPLAWIAVSSAVAAWRLRWDVGR
jgi:ABC-2 type transport system permease protein